MKAAPPGAAGPRRRAWITSRPRAATAAALAAVVFLLLAIHATSGHIWASEWATTNWFVARRTPAWNTAAIWISTCTEQVGVLVIAVAAGGVLSVMRRSWWPLAVALVATASSAVAVAGLKAAVARERPPVNLHLIVENDYSFPSGHSLGTMTVFLTLAWLGTHHIANPLPRALSYVGAGLAAMLVAASRLYLGVHWITDILAGWAAAATILATMALAATYVQHTSPGPGAKIPGLPPDDVEQSE